VAEGAAEVGGAGKVSGQRTDGGHRREVNGVRRLARGGAGGAGRGGRTGVLGEVAAAMVAWRQQGAGPCGRRTEQPSDPASCDRSRHEDKDRMKRNAGGEEGAGGWAAAQGEGRGAPATQGRETQAAGQARWRLGEEKKFWLYTILETLTLTGVGQSIK
jgi:hypothetical protein